jgi:hypothetical protein
MTTDRGDRDVMNAKHHVAAMSAQRRRTAAMNEPAEKH